MKKVLLFLATVAGVSLILFGMMWVEPPADVKTQRSPAEVARRNGYVLDKDGEAQPCSVCHGEAR
jgi:hypothetical protein